MDKVSKVATYLDLIIKRIVWAGNHDEKKRPEELLERMTWSSVTSFWFYYKLRVGVETYCISACQVKPVIV